MSLMPSEPAYILSYDVARFEHYDTDYYADLLIDNVSMEGRLSIYEEQPLSLPDPVVYRGYPPVVKALDFPMTDNSWLVMSSHMLKALQGVGELRHKKFPVVVADYRQLREYWKDKNGEFREEMVIRGYFVIQIFERLDIFDFVRSKFQRDPDYPDLIGNVDEYVLRIPVGGLPPVFHIKGDPVKTFVSHSARVALKNAGVKGVQYIQLSGIKGGQGMFVDVPVPDPGDG